MPRVVYRVCLVDEIIDYYVILRYLSMLSLVIYINKRNFLIDDQMGFNAIEVARWRNASSCPIHTLQIRHHQHQT